MDDKENICILKIETTEENQIVTCNNCNSVFSTDCIEFNKIEDKEICPCCNTDGCLMDIKGFIIIK